MLKEMENEGMTEFIEKYVFLIAAVLVGVVPLCWFLKWRNTQEPKKKRSFWDYYFLWPLLLSRKEGDHYVQRDFTRREWIGIISIGLLMLLALIFFSGKPQ